MQNSLAGNNRYKLISILHKEKGFSAYEALDIESDGRERLLINVYQDKAREMAGELYDLNASACAAFRGFFTENGAFAAVFSYSGGENFPSFFKKKGFSPFPDPLTPARRLAYANSFMREALACAALPDAVRLRAMNQQNIAVKKKSDQLSLNYILLPNRPQITFNAAIYPLLEQILPNKNKLCNEAYFYLSNLYDESFDNFASLYSAWRTVSKACEDDFINEKNPISIAMRHAKRVAKKQAETC